MISIRPEWCQLISSGKKTIEVRKTRPKLDLPFKCYIYQTQPKKSLVGVLHDGDELYGEIYRGKTAFIKTYKGVSAGSRTFGTWGKVIGEFVCDTFVTDRTFGRDVFFNGAACMTEAEASAYSGGKMLYGWHISNLKIYDKPKPLAELYGYCGFFPQCDVSCESCPVRCRPPQSWCYVEELK